MIRLWPRRRWVADDHDHDQDARSDRDAQGRLYDGDQVRPAGRERWADLLGPGPDHPDIANDAHVHHLPPSWGTR
jgi:hypothetical protein